MQVAAAGIRGSELARLPIPHPPVTTQRKIAAVLSAYDDLIENNTRRIQILEEMAQAIYRQWFVEYKFPEHEDVPLVDSGTALGELPEGWELKLVGELLEYYIGGGWGKEDPDDKHTLPAYVIRGTDIPGAREVIVDNCPLRIHRETNLKNRILFPNDIVFEVSGGSVDRAVGRALLVGKHLLDMFDKPVMCASFCKLIRVDDKKLIPHILYFHFQKIYDNGVIEKYQVQSTGIKNFKFTYFLEEELVVVPSKHIQNRFDEIVAPIFDLIGTLGTKNANLRATRDLLLPRLVSGQVEV